MKGHRRSILGLAIACLAIGPLVSCGPSGGPTPLELRARVEARLGEGEFEAAVFELNEAIRSQPDDPQLRVMMGRVRLAAGDGAAAEIALEKAISIGAESNRVIVALAEARLMQGRYHEVISMHDTTPELAPGARIRWLLTLAEARLRQSNTDPQRVRESLDALFMAWGSAAPDPTSERDSLASSLSALRDTFPAAESAYQHATCATPPVETVIKSTVGGAKDRRVLRVGPGDRLAAPSDAAAVAQDGDIIQIAAAEYFNDVAVWPQHDIVLRGVGGRPHIKVAGITAQDKAIWVIEGDRVSVEHIEFSGARSTNRNGAGIRSLGNGLTVRHSYFHHNENGILSWKSDHGEILIEHSEFSHNAHGDGQSHNIYIGETRKFTLAFSYSHHANIGHLVKSRAADNAILYNRLIDDQDGRSSYLIDLPEGGSARIIGNEMQKGSQADNPTFVSFAAENTRHGADELAVLNNTFYSRYLDAVMVKNHAEVDALIIDNLIAGAPGGILQGRGQMQNNLVLSEHGMLDPRNHDYRLGGDSPAIDRGSSVPDLDDYKAAYEYVHPLGRRKRRMVATSDVGAHEFCRQSLEPSLARSTPRVIDLPR